MRLIDADKLTPKLGVYESGRQMIYVDQKDINNAPEAFKWIPVSERLPEAEQDVLAMCRTSAGGKYFCTAIYIPKGMLRDDSWFNWDYEICEEYSEENDDYFVPEGWYERYYNYDEYGCVRIEDTVTHWAETVPEPAEEAKV